MNNRRRLFSALLACRAFLLVICLSFFPAAPHAATGIEQLLLNKVPLPTKRPSINPLANEPVQQPINVQPNPVAQTTRATSPVGQTSVNAISGSLKSGLDALSKKDALRALGIRKGMAGGSLDRKILAWAIALSGQKGISSGDIATIANGLPDWPGQKAMRRNLEAALAREGLSSRAIISAFGSRKPESLTGAVLLSRAYLATGNKKAARSTIAPFWHKTKLSKKREDQILKQVGGALTREDHRIRMHYNFYRDRVTAANRSASRAEQVSLARARSAVSKRASDAGKKLNAVAPSSKRDPGYTFSRIQYLRRAGKYKEAARLLASSPRDPVKLIHPDEWWVERRIISRHMIDLGDARMAYKLAAEHSATGRVKRAEAEFHAGWYALRFLKNSALARKHFAKVLKISGTPITQARGYYWLGRASSGGTATKHYKAAARYKGTYYGQLAAIKLGRRNLGVGSARVGAADRSRFAANQFVKAIKKLEAAGYAWRADLLYRHLAAKFERAGEVQILAARAEKRGNRTLALQVGKIAYRRGLAVETASWPLGAIPKSTKVGATGKALAYSIARQESAFNISAVSPANARGLLQLLPGTAKLMAKKKGLKYSKSKLTRDPAYNATLGAAYLEEQLENFGGSYILTFAGYNAGPGRSKEWIAKYGDPRGKSLDYVIDWVERIPFTETRNYVQRVMENYQIYKARIAGSALNIDRDLTRGRP